MSTPFRILFLTLLGFFLLTACDAKPYGENVPGEPAGDVETSTSQGLLTCDEYGVTHPLTCDSYSDCQPFETCVRGGWVDCQGGGCVGIDNAFTGYECIFKIARGYEPEDLWSADDLCGDYFPGSPRTEPPTPPTPDPPATTPPPPSSNTSVCGVVSPPPEQMVNDSSFSFCQYIGGWKPGETEVRPWIEVVADIEGSWFEILEATYYGVLPDGRSVPAMGTKANGVPISWVAHYRRDTWYKPWTPLDPPVSVASNRVYTVPTYPRLIHMGLDGNSGGNVYIGNFVDGYFVVVAKGSPTVKFRAGLNSNTNDPYVGHEVSHGDWVSCANAFVVFSSPRKGTADCSGTVINACAPNGSFTDCASAPAPVPPPSTPTPPPVTPSSSCPSTGIRVTAGPSLQSMCSGGVMVVTWDNRNAERASAPGQPLVIPDSWTGSARVTARCDASSYLSLTSASAAQAGFSQVCSQGEDITARTNVCNYNDGPKLSVAMSPNEAGTCQ